MTPTSKEIEQLRDHHRLAGRALAEHMHSKFPTGASSATCDEYLKIAETTLDEFYEKFPAFGTAERSIATMIVETEFRSVYTSLAAISLADEIRRKLA